MNCDAEFLDGKAALAFVVRDEACLLVVDRTKLLRLSSALEAEMKAIEWAIRSVCDNPGRNFCFSSDALVAVNEINSLKDPTGWYTREAVLFVRSILAEKEWKLCWNARTSNKFADYVAKMALRGNSNVMFFSFNLGNLPKELSDIYVADLLDCCPM